MRGLKTQLGYLLRLERGESLLEAIAAFVGRSGFHSAALTGIGAVGQVELGYFDVEQKTYDRRQLDGEYELIQLTGNVSTKAGEPFVHAHVTLGAADLSCLAGHLFAATVAVTAEIHLVPLGPAIERREDAEVGVALLDVPAL